MADIAQPPERRPGLAALSEAELLVVWMFRRLAAQPEAAGPLQPVLLLACGLARYEMALRALDGLTAVLRAHPRRPLRFHMLRCSGLSADERALLTLLAAQQRCRGEHARALAAWLVSARADEAAAHAAVLAHILAERGYHLPLPDTAAPPRAVAYRAGWPRPTPARRNPEGRGHIPL